MIKGKVGIGFNAVYLENLTKTSKYEETYSIPFCDFLAMCML